MGVIHEVCEDLGMVVVRMSLLVYPASTSWALLDASNAFLVLEPMFMQKELAMFFVGWRLEW